MPLVSCPFLSFERMCDTLELAVSLGSLAFVGNLARLGRLPRTRRIVRGELAVSDWALLCRGGSAF